MLVEECTCGHPKEGEGRTPGHYFGDQTMKTPCNYPGCPCPQFAPMTPPPSPEPARVTDTEAEAMLDVLERDIVAGISTPEALRLLADRARYQERIAEREVMILRLERIYGNNCDDSCTPALCLWAEARALLEDKHAE